MATIKSYSDLQQSKKLAEFLPLESADMFHFIHEVDTVGFGYKKEAAEFYSKTEFEYLPCWSLASLLGVLPQFIEFKGDKYYLRFMKDYVEYANDEVSITGRCLHTTGNDNLVDACYEMIIRLNKLNLL